MAVVGQERVDLERTELAAERNVLVDGDGLIAEEQDFPVHPGLVQVGKGFVVEGADTRAGDDFGADGAGEGLHADRSVCGRVHRRVLRRCRSGLVRLVLGPNGHQAERLQDRIHVVVAATFEVEFEDPAHDEGAQHLSCLIDGEPGEFAGAQPGLGEPTEARVLELGPRLEEMVELGVKT